MKGFRYQKRIRLPGGFRINLSKSGVGFSAGVPGLRMGIDSRGRRYTNVGIPGTGFGARRYLSNGKPAYPISANDPNYWLQRAQFDLELDQKILDGLPAEKRRVERLIEGVGSTNSYLRDVWQKDLEKLDQNRVTVLSSMDEHRRKIDECRREIERRALRAMRLEKLVWYLSLSLAASFAIWLLFKVLTT